MNSNEQRCGTCVYLDTTNIQAPFCRRMPPSLVVIRTHDRNDNGVRKFWPIVDPTGDWCGEYKPYDS